MAPKTSTAKKPQPPSRKQGRRRPRKLEPSLFHPGVGSDHAAKPRVNWIRSPNFDARNGIQIDTLVLHNTDGTLASAIQRFKDPVSQVSAHYIVDRDGRVTQMVSDSDTAWHSGNRVVNQRSIGIEVVAFSSARGMTLAQEATLIELAKYVLAAYLVALGNVLPHRDIKPTACPGWIWPTDSDFRSWTTQKLGRN